MSREPSPADRTSKGNALKIRRRQRGARYWYDLVTVILNRHCSSLSVGDVAFLAKVQQSAHRSFVPSKAQQDIIRSIQARIAGGSHVS